MTVRRCVLQSRGWEDAQGRGAPTSVFAAPQEIPPDLPAPRVTLSDTAVHHMSAGRRHPPLPAPHYLVLAMDHPPPRCPRGRAAACSGTPLNRSLERGPAGVRGVRSADPACAQCCWGRGTHRATAARGRGLRTHPAALGQSPSPRACQSCPGTAPSLTPQVSPRVQGQAERGCPQMGRAEQVGRKLLSWAQDMGAPHTDPTAPQPHEPWVRGLQGSTLGGSQGKEHCRCVLNEGRTPT